MLLLFVVLVSLKRRHHPDLCFSEEFCEFSFFYIEKLAEKKTENTMFAVRNLENNCSQLHTSTEDRKRQIAWRMPPTVITAVTPIPTPECRSTFDWQWSPYFRPRTSITTGLDEFRRSTAYRV